MNTSLWDLMSGTGIAAPFARHRPAMLPDDALKTTVPVQRKFKPVDTLQHQVSSKEPGPLTWTSRAEGLTVAAWYVRLRAWNIGRIPVGHPAAGAKAWLFVDEVLVNPEVIP
jgi:hypothetical protein